MTLEEYEKEKGCSTSTKNNYIKALIIRTLLTIILVFSILIITNFSSQSKKVVEKHLFKTDFKFSSINTLFNKYFLNIKKLTKTKEIPVNSDEVLDFSKASVYKDGISISVEEDTPVSLIESGIVVFCEEKEGYGKTIIIQQSNGIDVWYGNINNVEVSLYDYLEKNTIIGSSYEKLYLVFQKNGEFVDYKTIIQ